MSIEDGRWVVWRNMAVSTDINNQRGVLGLFVDARLPPSKFSLLLNNYFMLQPLTALI